MENQKLTGSFTSDNGGVICIWLTFLQITIKPYIKPQNYLKAPKGKKKKKASTTRGKSIHEKREL